MALLYLSNPTIDEIVHGSSRRVSVGGPGLHGSWAARKLGISEIHLVGSIAGEDASMVEEAYQRVGVVLHLFARSRCTTRFRLVYGTGRRRAQLLCSAEPLDASETLAIIEALRPEIIIAAPVLDEVPVALLEKVSRLAGLMALDLQGYVRSGLLSSVLNAVLRPDLIHVSSDDVDEEVVAGVAASASRQGAVLYYTRGGDGVDIYLPAATGPLRVPVAPVKGDPTGAGDVFTTAASILLWRGLDAVEAGVAAARLASRYVAGSSDPRGAPGSG